MQRFVSGAAYSFSVFVSLCLLLLFLFPLIAFVSSGIYVCICSVCIQVSLLPFVEFCLFIRWVINVSSVSSSVCNSTDQEEGEKYMYSQPDIVGISVDCVNVALLHPLSAEAIVSSSWFEALSVSAIQYTPTCHHPKVTSTRNARMHACMHAMACMHVEASMHASTAMHPYIHSRA